LLVDHLSLAGSAGTNKVMAGELSRLVRRAFNDVHLPEPDKEGDGAIVYPFDVRTAAVAVRYHRTSARVLWSLYQSRAARLEPLYDDLFADVSAETRPWLKDGVTFSVSPAATREFAAGGRQLVGVVKNALIDGAKRRGLTLSVDPTQPDLSFQVKVHGGAVTVSLDLGGQSMALRGYRTEGGHEAPLRENLAAVLVMLARHDARCEALLDPMCGSGTIAIEAACMAQARSVWVAPRAPAAARLPLVGDVLTKLVEPLFADTRPLVLANELDPAVHAHSRANFARAGVADLVKLSCGDFRTLDPRLLRDAARERGLDPDRGLILCNPPYGERMRSPDLLALYRDLGGFCRQLGWRAAFLVANPDFESAYGQRARVKKPLSNGPLRAMFYLYDSG
jgi:23S rRNA G2445 N2-methylase RlmL